MMKPSPETTMATATSSRSASTTTTTTTTTTTVSFLSNLMQDLFKYTILGFAGGLGFQLSLYCMQVRQQRSSDEQCRSSSAEVPGHKQHTTFFSSSDITILKKIFWGNLDVSVFAEKSVFWVRSLFCHGRSFLFGDSDGNGECGGNESVSPEKKLFEDEEEETERIAAFATPQQKSKSKEVRLQQQEQRYRSGSIGSIGTVASQKDESNQTTNNNMKTSSSIPNSSGRYLEILVHNIAHTDLVLSLGSSSCDDDKEENTRKDQNEGSTQHHHYGISSENHNKDWILCRPRFSAFSLFSERILQSLLSSSNTLNNNDLGRIISFPKYERNETSPRYSLVTPRVSRRGVTPVGLDLSSSSSSSSSQKKESLEVGPSELASLRVRGRDLGKVPEMEEIMKWWRERDEKGTNTDTTTSITTATNNATHNSSKNRYHINAVFFPLLSTLIGRWQESIKQKYSKQHNVKKVVILISGKGTPRNWTHSIHGNSTQFCADLMEIFLKQVYNNSGMGDDITVVKIHSDSNIFRYDENILFTKRELLPCIDTWRDAHACNLPYPDEEVEQGSESIITKNNNNISSPTAITATANTFNPDWKDSFHVSLSFADGSPARTYAIQASLRTYKPTYFHVWQLKTFWHETKITPQDVEVHGFEEMETTPAVEIQKTSQKVQMVVAEMLRFKEEYVQNLLKDDTDIYSFWLRKTKKPVLAVLLLQDSHNGELMLHRGTNMEVSMPTGSLCAERNVIGTALAMNPSLKREHLLMVAVLAIPTAQILKERTHPMYCTVIKQPDGNSDTAGQQVIEDTSSSTYNNNHQTALKRNYSITSFVSILEEENDNSTKEEDDDEEEEWVKPSSPTHKGIESTLPLPAKVSDSPSCVPPLNLGPLLINNGNPPPLPPPHSPIRRVHIYTDTDADSTSENGGGGRRSRSSSFSQNSSNNTNLKRSIPTHTNNNNNVTTSTINPSFSPPSNSSNNAVSLSSPLHKPNKNTTSMKKSVVFNNRAAGDINPLLPCGACNEWLKKIAECNPYFKVLTFTDADCNGVYINSCQE